MDQFPASVSKVITLEGGYVLDAKDPGGETNMGISKRSFPRVDIKNLTRQQAEDIYYKFYWDPAKVAQLAPALQPLYFDTAVNCGVVAAIRILQLAAGIQADGIFGPMTALAATRVSLKAYAVERMRYYGRLIARNPALKRYLHGWTNRVNSYLK
jgi:lysozyme family protein